MGRAVEFSGVIPNLSSVLSVHCEPDNRGVQGGLCVHACMCYVSV